MKPRLTDQGSPHLDDLIAALLMGQALLDQPALLLRRCHQRADEILTRTIGRDGPTRRQLVVLFGLYQRPNSSLIELARETGIDRATLAQIMRRLQSGGFIRRKRSSSDRRAHELSVTAEGIATLQNAMPLIAAGQAEMLRPLKVKERKLLMELLKRMLGEKPKRKERRVRSTKAAKSSANRAHHRANTETQIPL